MVASRRHSSTFNFEGAVVNLGFAHEPTQRWQLGRVLPRFLLLLGIVEVFLLVALSVFSFYEVGDRRVRFRVTGDAFVRNLNYVEMFYGDMTRIGNLLPHEGLLRGVFSTDSFGFRNSHFRQPIAGIIYGDSFAYGARDDHNVLAVQFGRE